MGFLSQKTITPDFLGIIVARILANIDGALCELFFKKRLGSTTSHPHL
jgi:hypothetical protein